MRWNVSLYAVALAFIAAPCFGAIGAIEPGENSHLFHFNGLAAGGVASGNMTITVSSVTGGTKIISEVNNTSPLALGVNSPGIVGWGFDLNQDITSAISSWVIKAYDTSNTLVELGSSLTSGPWQLDLDAPAGGFTVKLYGNVPGAVDNLIYNPNATGGYLGSDTYFTSAYLEMTITEDVAVKYATGSDGTVAEKSPIIIFNNVGAGGAGMVTAIADDQVQVLPEPASMAVWGLGLAMFGGVGFWRRRQQKMAA